jgi:hypothetical protein
MQSSLDLDATIVRAPAPRRSLAPLEALARSRRACGARVRQAGREHQHAVGRGDGRIQPRARRARPRAAEGLIIRSGKASGFIAGADIDEFTAIATEEGAVALVKRGWDTFERLAAVRYPTLALIRGYCLGGGLELALACRYRVAVDEPGTRMGCPR